MYTAWVDEIWLYKPVPCIFVLVYFFVRIGIGYFEYYIDISIGLGIGYLQPSWWVFRRRKKLEWAGVISKDWRRFRCIFPHYDRYAV